MNKREQVNSEDSEFVAEPEPAISGEPEGRYEEFAAENTAAEQKILTAAERLGFSAGETKEFYESRGIGKKLESIKNRAEAAWRKFRRASGIGLAALMLSQTPDAGLSRVFAGDLEKPKVTESAGDFDWEKFERYALTERNEYGFISLNHPLAVKKVVEGEANSVYVDLFEFEDEIERGEVSKIYFTHTHPLELYDQLGYSDEDLKRIRNREKDAPPAMPPSAMDIPGSIRLARRYADKNIQFEEAVAGTDGVWTYSVDLDHKFIKKVYGLFDELESRVRNYFDSLPEEEAIIFKNKGVSFSNYNELFEEMKSQHDIGPHRREIENIIEDTAEEHEDILQEFVKFNHYAMAISYAKDKKIENELEKKYTGFAKKRGIRLSHSSYSELGKAR